MLIIGIDYHPSFQQIAFMDQETGEYDERRLNHSDGEAERFYRELKQKGVSVRVGMEATGYSRWFERLLAELGFEVWIGDAAEISRQRVRKQKTDREDARLLLRLLRENRFPRIWVPSPENRRVPKIDQLKPAGAFKPEPALANEDYEEILRIMQNMVHVMELSPHAFHNMGEEDLRSHFLVQLNGAFKGQATGETFNFQGKTDILIRFEGKNVFVAECKFWKGEKALLATLDSSCPT